MPDAPDFSEYVLASLPALSKRLAQADCMDWLDKQDSMMVDGARRWLVWGDRLASAAEMKLNWARERGLIDPTELARSQGEFGTIDPDPDVEAVEIDPGLNDQQESKNGR